MSEKKEPDMVAMMSKLLKRQAASDFDIDIFAGDPVGYHISLQHSMRWL